MQEATLTLQEINSFRYLQKINLYIPSWKLMILSVYSFQISGDMLPNEGEVYFYGQQGAEDHPTGLGFSRSPGDNAGLLHWNPGNVLTEKKKQSGH